MIFWQHQRLRQRRASLRGSSLQAVPESWPQGLGHFAAMPTAPTSLKCMCKLNREQLATLVSWPSPRNTPTSSPGSHATLSVSHTDFGLGDCGIAAWCWTYPCLFLAASGLTSLTRRNSHIGNFV
eukprot:2632343-Rhodomonas_salina.1